MGYQQKHSRMMPNTYMHRYLFLSTLCILCLEGCSNTPQDPSTENDEGLAALAGPTIELTIEEGCNPLATTNECLFPLPSRFFEKRDSTSPTGVRWNFQDSNLALPDGTTPILFERYNRADGASPMMPILLHFGVDIDPAVLIPREKIALSTTKDSLVSLYDLETNEKVPFMLEMDSNLRETGEYDGRFALMIRPMRPMKMGHRHAVIIETGLKDISGKTIDSPPRIHRTTRPPQDHQCRS